MRRVGAEAYRFDRDLVEKAYAGWAPVYDVVFGPVTSAGRLAAVGAAERIGGRILEVGIGTGISLGEYSAHNRIVGIDLSEPMLRRARDRVRRRRLSNVEALALMDAECLAFENGYFDVVVAQYVISAVPQPEAALDEFARVLKPGGEIVLVNHLGAESGLLRLCETGIAPVVRHLGWRPEFQFARIAAWSQRAGFRLLERTRLKPFGHFTLMRYRRAH